MILLLHFQAAHRKPAHLISEIKILVKTKEAGQNHHHLVETEGPSGNLAAQSSQSYGSSRPWIRRRRDSLLLVPFSASTVSLLTCLSHLSASLRDRTWWVCPFLTPYKEPLMDWSLFSPAHLIGCSPAYGLVAFESGDCPWSVWPWPGGRNWWENTQIVTNSWRKPNYECLSHYQRDAIYLLYFLHLDFFLSYRILLFFLAFRYSSNPTVSYQLFFFLNMTQGLPSHTS